ncbi:MAG: oxidoreductase [Myxococcota bacterium]
MAIVTGANSGVGYETAIGLAKAGFQVIMACRTITRGNAARDKILAGQRDAQLEVSELDLSRFASVRVFAERFRAAHDRLDILVNNAGVLDYSGRRNEDGLELQLVTNHLGHFLLTSLLLDRMPDTSESRVVSLSSIAHKRGRIAFDDLNCENPPRRGFAYAQSKVAGLVFSDELDRRLRRAGRKLLSVCAHPGVTASGLFGDLSRLQQFAFKLLAPLLTHSNADSARPTLYAALEADVQGGEYFGPQGFLDLKGPPGRAKRTRYSQDPEVAVRLWAASEDLIGEPFVVAPMSPGGQSDEKISARD